MDEVHERNISSDFLIVIMKDLLIRRFVCIPAVKGQGQGHLHVNLYVCKRALIVFSICECSNILQGQRKYYCCHCFLKVTMSYFHICRPDLKLILMSATINAEMFSAYFGKCTFCLEQGRLMLLTTFFSPLRSSFSQIKPPYTPYRMWSFL